MVYYVWRKAEFLSPQNLSIFCQNGAAVDRGDLPRQHPGDELHGSGVFPAGQQGGDQHIGIYDGIKPPTWKSAGTVLIDCFIRYKCSHLEPSLLTSHATLE